MTIIDEVRGPSLEEQFAALPATEGAKGTTEPFTARLVRKLGDALLARTSRRGFLAGTAAAGAAIVTAPKTYALTPTSAMQSICGPSSSCSSGYTAFCCTINAGKNTCPPGSLAGGWWKADGSGFCCGGARYYIDCHYTCTNCSTGCGGYKSFCKAGCHPGGCTCATGDCDKRRTNCNYFRYGQCNTQISCTGPVLCRVISCTPPWNLYSCTTSSATDNYTATHSASCLPDAGCLSKIDQWWWDHGGPGSSMGATTTALTNVTGGSKRGYANGWLFYTSTRGLLRVMKPISDHYTKIGSETSPLGWPIANQVVQPDGGITQRFEKGLILYKAPNAPVAAYGLDLARFDKLGGIAKLGYPIAFHEAQASGGYRDRYTIGNLYVRPGATPFLVSGAILAEYRKRGETSGALGYPTAEAQQPSSTVGSSHSDTIASAKQTFQGGYIAYNPLRGGIRVVLK